MKEKELKLLKQEVEEGCVDETVKPCEINLNRGDVCIKTRYEEKEFRMAVFGTSHEYVHA